MSIRFLTLDDQLRGILEDRIATYESRYEMSSKEMAKALSDGDERETAEKLKWMFDYHVLVSLTKAQTPTTGTPGTDTRLSMRNASLATSS